MVRTRKVGLALGGGGIRGAAHVGVIRILQKAGVPIDLIAGSSSGALVGGITAAGVPWERVFLHCVDAPWLRLLDLRPWGTGLLQGQRLVDWVAELVGDPAIEELAIPFGATAVDLVSGDLVVFREGSLLKAIRASTALPGVFSPVEDGDRLLVDGAILSTVPVRLARSMGADTVIAVDVRHDPPVYDGKRQGAVDRARWAVVRHLVNQELSEADLVIVPRVGDVHSLDFRRAVHCIAAGQRAARRALPGVRRVMTDDATRQVQRHAL